MEVSDSRATPFHSFPIAPPWRLDRARASNAPVLARPSRPLQPAVCHLRREVPRVSATRILGLRRIRATKQEGGTRDGKSEFTFETEML